MIGTIEIKQQQLTKGYFSVGEGEEIILIVGSCRAVPYVNYFNEWNNNTENYIKRLEFLSVHERQRFKICFVDPFNWNWNINDERVDYVSELEKQEKNEDLLYVLKNCSIFIHEYYVNFGMFNCSKECEKNIYNFGMNAKIDISIPAFNDIFILTRDIVSFDTSIRAMAIQDYNVIGKLSEHTLKAIDIIREKNLAKFYDICGKTSFPEFAGFFKKNYKFYRLFWTFNHIAKGFTEILFIQICNIVGIQTESLMQGDMYANNYTYLCEYDNGYEWNEETKPLKDSLF